MVLVGEGMRRGGLDHVGQEVDAVRALVSSVMSDGSSFHRAVLWSTVAEARRASLSRTTARRSLPRSASSDSAGSSWPIETSWRVADSAARVSARSQSTHGTPSAGGRDGCCDFSTTMHCALNCPPGRAGVHSGPGVEAFAHARVRHSALTGIAVAAADAASTAAEYAAFAVAAGFAAGQTRLEGLQQLPAHLQDRLLAIAEALPLAARCCW